MAYLVCALKNYVPTLLLFLITISIVSSLTILHSSLISNNIQSDRNSIQQYPDRSTNQYHKLDINEHIHVYIIGSYDVEKQLSIISSYKSKFNVPIVVSVVPVINKSYGKGIYIITRCIYSNELEYIKQIMLQGCPVISLDDKATHEIMDKILSKYAPFYAIFNGTHIYLFKLYPHLKVIDNKYAVLVKGYADRKLNYLIISDAIKVLTEYQSGWKVLGWIEWSSGDAWKPYGRLNLEHEILYYKVNDNTMLYSVKCITQIISGVKLGWNKDNDAWWNDYIVQKYYLNAYTNIYDLRDYDPTSINNEVPSISISLTWPPSPTLSWTYSGNYIMSVDDNSDLWTNVAAWKHDLGTPLVFDYATKETVKIEPGFLFTESPIQGGRQKWVITGGWVVPARYYPYKPFSGTIVICVVFTT